MNRRTPRCASSSPRLFATPRCQSEQAQDAEQCKARRFGNLRESLVDEGDGRSRRTLSGQQVDVFLNLQHRDRLIQVGPIRQLLAKVTIKDRYGWVTGRVECLRHRCGSRATEHVGIPSQVHTLDQRR